MLDQHRHSVSASAESGASLRWGILVVGLLIGLIGMDLMIRRPLMRELTQVRSNVATLERDVQELVGVRNQVWETNNLLTSLKSQYRQIEEARLSVAAIQQLNKELETETSKTTAAFAALDRLVSLQNSMLKNSAAIETAHTNLEQLIALQNQAVQAGEGASRAFAAINSLVRVRDAANVEIAEVDSAFTSVKKLGELKQQVLENGAAAETARDQLADLINLKNDVYNEASNIPLAQQATAALIALKNQVAQNAAGISEAQAAAGDLVALKDELASNGQTDAAFVNTDRLFELRDALSTESNLAGAEDNLHRLIGIERELNDQSQQVASAVQTLEVLTDLSTELQNQVEVLGSMRKSLMDIVLMEATVNRVVRVIEPLTQLGNLRRMTDDELREAARAVIDSRTSRVARKPESIRETSGDTLKLDTVRLFQDEQTKDILVPMPPQENIDHVLKSVEK